MFDTYINMVLLVGVITLFANIYVAVDNILTAMLVHSLVHFIWFLLWLPMVFCGTIYTANLFI